MLKIRAFCLKAALRFSKSGPGFALPIFQDPSDGRVYTVQEVDEYSRKIAAFKILDENISSAIVVNNGPIVRVGEPLVYAFITAGDSIHVGTLSEITPILREFMEKFPERADILLQIAELIGDDRERSAARMKMGDKIRQWSGHSAARAFWGSLLQVSVWDRLVADAPDEQAARRILRARSRTGLEIHGTNEITVDLSALDRGDYDPESVTKWEQEIEAELKCMDAEFGEGTAHSSEIPAVGIIDPIGKKDQVNLADPNWQGSVPYYSKSASQKLQGIADAFGFAIEPRMLDDHEELATLRWKLQSGLGRENPVATKALTKLFFAYLKDGHEFLYNKDAVDQLLKTLISEYREYDVHTNVSSAPGGQLKVLEAAAANPLIAKYHFLGYGRDDGLHLGLQCGEGSDGLTAVATFSPWDIDHADHILDELDIAKSEILVLSRLLSVPGRRRVALSQFIAQLVGWVHREMKGIKAIATYCNPNIGQYGTVYRGANFIPLCFEEHAFALFMGDEYVSPTKVQEVYDDRESGSLDQLEFGVVTPLPLLLYWYPIRGPRKRARALGLCRYPYPDDLVNARVRRSKRGR